MSSERRGRPRSEAARVAILAATRDIVVERGYGGLTMVGIAERAGTGVQTLYRWWPDKGAIVAECVLENLVVIELITAEYTGDAAADLRSWLRASYAGLTAEPAAALFRALSVVASNDGVVAARLDEQLGEPLRGALVRLLETGIEAGRFRNGISSATAAEVLVGAMLSEVVTGRTPTPTKADDIADLILAGLLAPGSDDT